MSYVSAAWDLRTDPEQEVQRKAVRVLEGLDRLKVNRLSLAAESRIIRKLANQRRGLHRHSLKQHRAGRIRTESRAAHLASCFVRGREYAVVEGPETQKRVDRKLVLKKAQMVVPNVTAEDVDIWIGDEER